MTHDTINNNKIAIITLATTKPLYAVNIIRL